MRLSQKYTAADDRLSDGVRCMLPCTRHGEVAATTLAEERPMQLGPMEFGVFHEFPRSEGMTDSTGFANGFELVDTAERLGLDAMWLAELHISPRSVLASPIAIAAAIAARTERMKIGTAV